MPRRNKIRFSNVRSEFFVPSQKLAAAVVTAPEKYQQNNGNNRIASNSIKAK